MFDSFYLDGVAPPQGFGKGFLMEFSGQPSFLTSGEMWASLDSGETQTLAAWKDGYVLRENPDGSMTAEPKFTSGIPPLTLRRVPTMGAENRAFATAPAYPNIESCAGDSVKVFEHCFIDPNFKAGKSRTLAENSGSVGSWNAKSLWVPKGYTVTLYPDNVINPQRTDKEVVVGPECVKCLTTPSNTITVSEKEEDENGELECKQEDCPPNHMAVKKTDADGIETCECVSGEAIGEGVKAIGKGLGMIAIAGVLTTGILVYGIYRVIRG
jgi:hypothetical protein